MPVRQETVQIGTIHRLMLEVTTDPAELGKAAGFLLRETIITVGSTRTNLGLSTPKMVERAHAPSSPNEAATDGTPAYSAGLGPMGENVYIVTVDDSSPFSVGMYVRAKNQPAGQGIVHEVLAIPDGITMHLHSSTGDFDIVDGDTVEEVTPSGVYIGVVELDVDIYLGVSTPTAELHAVMDTENTGNDPVFTVIQQLNWTWALELDLTGRGFTAG